MGLIPHRIIVLNEGHKLFPKDTEIAGLLADAYSEHPQLQQNQKGREFIEKFMHIEYENELPVASKLTQNDYTLLMGLFNTYIQQNDWESIISFCNSVSQYNLDSLIIMRNKIRALIEIGDYTTAEKELLDMINEYPDEDSLQTLLSSLYRETGDYTKALCAQENALFIAPQDTTHYLNLVIDILNRGFIHNRQGDIIGPLDKKKQLIECLPIMNYALEIDSSPAVRIQVSKLLAKRNANKEANEVITAGYITTQEKSLELEYLIRKIESQG
jgi:tetratricopeptide (TPR) repeat protein